MQQTTQTSQLICMSNSRSITNVHGQRCSTRRFVFVWMRIASHCPALTRAAGAPLIITRTLYRHQQRCQHVSARIQPVPSHCPWNCPRNIQNKHGHHCKHGNKCRTRTNDSKRCVQKGGGTDGGHAAEAGGRGASGFCFKSQSNCCSSLMNLSQSRSRE